MEVPVNKVEALPPMTHDECIRHLQNLQRSYPARLAALEKRKDSFSDLREWRMAYLGLRAEEKAVRFAIECVRDQRHANSETKK